MIKDYDLIERRSTRYKIINYLITAFFIHGFVFFLMPNEIYNLNSPLRYIKYPILALTLIIVLNKCKPIEIVKYIVSAIILFSINFIAVGNNFSLISLFTYVIPLSIFFFYDGLAKYLNAKKIAAITYIFATIFGYYEFFFLGGVFSRFSSSGYRIVSIFVNPNNFAITMVILTTYILRYKLERWKLMVLLLNSSILIFLSGSKTALLVFVLINILYLIHNTIALMIKNHLIRISTLLYTIFFSLLSFIVIFFLRTGIKSYMDSLLKQTRSFDTLFFSAGARFNQYSNFFDTYNLVFPWRNFINYTDNIYLHIWGMFGIGIFILFLGFNVYLLFITILRKKTHYSFLLIVFLVSGLSTNVLYIWSISYMYWYLIGTLTKKH